jgi:peptidoglycan hydrolase-like protein with peptidoglycan-binding domain
MFRRGLSLVLGGAVTLGLGSCGSNTPTRAGSTTAPSSSTTAFVATSTTANVSGAATTVSPGSATTVHTGTTAHGANSTTTVAGRVVTKPSDNVHLGDTGPGVTQVQTALVAQGYKVSVDGKFGAQTATAVKDFQAKNALKQDGIVGPATWAKLQAAPTATTTKAATTTTVKRTTTT